MSHRYLRNSPHFKKTMDDIQIMRKHGAHVPNFLLEWYERRMKETYTYFHPNLNVKKGEFFNGDGVNYVYDHDSIHEAMKHMEMPAYKYYQDPSSEVSCSQWLFWKCTQYQRLCGVLEEAYVLALERSQIPFAGTVSPERSFNMALEKVCTSITSGWFREFAWEHYYDVMKMYSAMYVEKFRAGVRAGIVKRS
jgi:hypothetical protein